MAAITLRNVPADVFKIILDEQAKEKQSKGIGQFSLERAVYKLIKDCAKCREPKEGKSK